MFTAEVDGHDCVILALFRRNTGEMAGLQGNQLTYLVPEVDVKRFKEVYDTAVHEWLPLQVTKLYVTDRIGT